MRKLMALCMLLVLVIAVSGCLEDDFCRELEQELAKRNVTCRCVRTDFVPIEYRNASVEPKCSCMCNTENGWVNATIAVPQD